jgi:long-chain fatty acid transport protein
LRVEHIQNFLDYSDKDGQERSTDWTESWCANMFRTRLTNCFFAFVVAVAATTFPSLVIGQGILLPWAGSVNQSMGGAGTAAPQDAISAVYWNPAAMADMKHSELSASLGTLFPVLETDSSVGFGALSGTSSGNAGFAGLPYVGWVQKLPDPRFTMGLGIAAAAGIKTNYAASTTNPIFFPQSNTPGAPGGFGQLYSEAEFLQILPSLSYAVNDRLSIGITPIASIGQVTVDPLLFAGPDDADGSGQPRYPSGRGTKLQWGGGFQLSTHYKASPCLSFGAMIKSPQWFQTFEVTGTNELGLPRDMSVELDLPMIISVGMASTAIRNTVLAVDLRYVDNKNTDGFGPSGFLPDGSLAGLGWSNQFGINVGAQRNVNDVLTLRGGYFYTSSLLSDAEAMIAVAAPLHYHHGFSGGASIHMTRWSSFNFAYTYLLENELSGPLLSPAGALPGSNVTTRLSAHEASLGVVVKY